MFTIHKQNYKQYTVVGFIGMLIGSGLFTFNYHMVPTSFPGYEILAAPAMFLLSFFSEETAFIPKIVLFLSGQFIGYFVLAFSYNYLRLLIIKAL